jgi:hypothetical protein
MSKQDFLTAKESAAHIKCSRQWFYKIKDYYGLNAVDFGSSVKLYPFKEVDRVRRMYAKERQCKSI